MTTTLILLIFVALTTNVLCVYATDDADAAVIASPNSIPLVTIGLVADNHYDTFPAGEKAPWEPMNHWLQEQARRTSTPLKRRYDLARDKMLEAVDVFNRIDDPRPLTFAVNLGDLVNNDMMWNLKPILDAFNTIKAPKFSLLGNHERRSHNDRFGKNNKTQESWMMSKLGLSEWFYEIDYAPFMFVFLDSMVMEEPEATPKRRQQLQWLRATLTKARELKRVVVLFGHISIGLQTSPFAPIIKEFFPHVVGGFFGHHHKGGYVLQDGYFHTTIIQGQIETMTNAFAVLEIFRDRMELTGFGRVPTRVMRFEKKETRDLIDAYFAAASPSTKTNAGERPVVAFGKASKEHGYEDLVIGGRHQPAASPEKVFPRSEVLQKPPPLHLNLPSYRKPLIAAAEPNPGETRFLRKVYSKWPRRQKTLAPEEPVDLMSYHNNNNNNKKSSPASSGGLLYQIGGKEDPAHKGKIVAQHHRDQQVENNNVVHSHKNGEVVDDVVAETTRATTSLSKKTSNNNIINNKNQQKIAVINDPRDEVLEASVNVVPQQQQESSDRLFFIVEAVLVVLCGMVVLFFAFRFRRVALAS